MRLQITTDFLLGFILNCSDWRLELLSCQRLFCLHSGTWPVRFRNRHNQGWHWIRDTQHHEDAHRWQGNGAGVMALLRIAALYFQRPVGFRSIQTGTQPGLKL